MGCGVYLEAVGHRHSPPFLSFRCGEEGKITMAWVISLGRPNQIMFRWRGGGSGVCLKAVGHGHSVCALKVHVLEVVEDAPAFHLYLI